MSLVLNISREDLVKEWIAALRSGEYKQGQGVLHKCGFDDGVERYCCLGIVCKIAVDRGAQLAVDTTNAAITYNGEAGILPMEMRAFLRLRDGSATFDGSILVDENAFGSLTEANDGTDSIPGATFDEIADIIEHHADQVFRPDDE